MWSGVMKSTMFSGNSDAVSEVIGAILLVVIAVGAFALIYSQVFPVKLPGPEPHVQLAGYVTSNNKVVLEHIGGEELTNYEILVEQSDGSHNSISETTPWQIGECYYLNNNLVNYSLFNTTKQVTVRVTAMMKDGSTHIVFDGIITPKDVPPGPSRQPLPDPMSISTLLTNTTDEDLICYNYTIHAKILPQPHTFIYNWMWKIDPNPDAPYYSLTRLLMPFDTQNPFFTKDYSGNNNNGTIEGAIWTNGKLGGAYQFSGNSFITIPYCFTNNKIDAVTIEAWIKTSQSSGIILSYNRSNYAELAISGGHVKWSTNSSDGIVDVNGTILVNNNAWHLIAVTYNSTSGVCSIYVDGRLDASCQAHRTNKLLGSGNSPAGAIGERTGVTSRKTIFSTGFETRDETNNWNEDNSSALGIKDAVDTNASNVDSSLDKGTETNFVNAQGTTPDGNSMTIQEADTAGQDHKTAVQGNTCDVDSSPDKGTEVKFSNAQRTSRDSNVMWINESDYGVSAVNEHLYVDSITNTTMGWTFVGPSPALQAIGGGSITTSTDTAVRRWFGFTNTASAGDGLTVSFSVYVTAGDGNDDLQWAIDTNGDNTAEYSGTINNPVGSKWYNTGTIAGLATGALVNSSRVSFTYLKTNGGSNTMTVDASQLNVTRAAVPNYKIDFEYQWTRANYSDTTETLCFYVGAHTGSENLGIKYRSGSSWAWLGNITGAGWKNVTATGLTSSTYTIQLIGNTETGDTTQDKWSIDCIFLHSFNASSYQINVEYQWTAAVYNMVNEQVCLYTASHTGSENLLVNYWTGSAWASLGTITGTGWSNFTATGLTSSTYTIQLIGASESGDSSQDTWKIDALFLHVWTTQRTFDILPSTALTPHTGSYSLGGSGDFYPAYTLYNRTDINISGYQTVQLSVWYSYENTESNDFFGLYYKNNSQWNPIFEITNPTQSGQKNWAQVIVTIPHTLNSLRLQFKWRTTSSNEYVAIDDLNITGIPLDNENNFTGIIDEVKIYQRELSPEQLYQNYLCTKDGNSSRSVLISEEIRIDERWKCIVTPNNGIQDDVATESNLLVVKNYGGGG